MTFYKSDVFGFATTAVIMEFSSEELEKTKNEKLKKKKISKPKANAKALAEASIELISTCKRYKTKVSKMGSFTDLIKKCASNDPKKRPTIDQVIEHLETLFQLADIEKKLIQLAAEKKKKQIQLAAEKKRLIQLADETKKKLINPADEKKKLFGCLPLPWLI